MTVTREDEFYLGRPDSTTQRPLKTSALHLSLLHAEDAETEAGQEEVVFLHLEGKRCAEAEEEGEEKGDEGDHAERRREHADAAATAHVDPAILADPAAYPAPEARERLRLRLAFGPKEERQRMRLWSRVKTGL